MTINLPRVHTILDFIRLFPMTLNWVRTKEHFWREREQHNGGYSTNVEMPSWFAH